MGEYYKLLWQVNPEMPKPNLLRISKDTLNSLQKVDGTKFAFDFECSGLDIHAPVYWVRSVSVHNDEYSASIELRELDGDVIDIDLERELFGFLARQSGLIAHNYFFEGSVLYRATGTLVPAHCDTRKLFMDLANEGYDGQSWALDEGITRLLKWPLNDIELNRWLKSKKLTKADMCQAPFDILGRYNQLDAAATWEMYKLFSECITDYHDTWGQYYWDYHHQDFMTLCLLQIEAYKTGLHLDLANLKQYCELVTSEMEQALQTLRDDPRVSVFVEEFEDYQKAQVVNKHEKYTKTGTINKNWLRFEKSKDDKLNDITFNFNSSDQIKWLITKIFDVKQSGKVYKVYEKE